jgi:hypothetical protein
MGAVPIPDTSWVRVLPGYRCMRIFFCPKKKIFPIRVGSSPVRVGYGRGPKLSQTTSFPLDFFFSLTRFSLLSLKQSHSILSLKQSHSILSLTSSLYRRREMEGALILDLRRRKVLRLWTCGEEGAPILISLMNMKIRGRKKEEINFFIFEERKR